MLRQLRPGTKVRIRSEKEVRETLKDPNTTTHSYHVRNRLAFFIPVGMKRYCGGEFILGEQAIPKCCWKMRGTNGMAWHEDWFEVLE